MTVATVAFCFAATALYAGQRRAVAPPVAPLSIEFVHVSATGSSFTSAGADAWLDLDAVGQQAGSMGKSVLVRRQFGLRVVRAGGVAWGSATVTARLSAPDNRSSVRLDGQPLGSTPIVVSSRAAVGSLTIHTLEIEVSNAVPQGPLSASISWEATSH